MKLLSILLLALMSFAGFAQNNYLDARGVVQTNAVEFLTVVNKTTTPITLTRGMAVCFKNSALDGISVDLCSAEGAKPVGLIASTSCPINARCKLQNKGFFAFGNFLYLATPTTPGGMVYAGVAGNIVRPATRTVDMFPLGVTFEAVAASSTVLKVYLDL